MATYDKKANTLVFTCEESEESACPDCGAGLDIKPERLVADKVVKAWACPACGLTGEAFGVIRFERHVVDLTNVRRSKLLSNTTRCINGVIRVGDLVLSTIDDIMPCMPGRVVAIDLLGSDEHRTDSKLDDVHVDFTVFSHFFSEERKQSIANYLSGFYLQQRLVADDDLIVWPDCLIKISDVAPETMTAINYSEESALRHAYRVVRNMLPRLMA